MYNPNIKVRLTETEMKEVAKEMVNLHVYENKVNVPDLLNNLKEDSKMFKFIRQEWEVYLNSPGGKHVVVQMN